MAITLIIIGSLLLILGLILSLKSIKPMYLNVISGLVILIGTFFGLFGKQLQDKSSSEKSDNILNTSVNTETKVDNLKIQNTLLTQKVDKQNSTIDSLRKENTDLYLKLADASIKIYNEITGGISIPFIKVSVFYNRKSNSEIRANRKLEPFDNKWVTTLVMENTGDYDINNIDVLWRLTQRYTNDKNNHAIPIIEKLRAKDLIDLLDPIVLADPKFAEKFPDQHINAYEIKVKWKVEYYCIVKLAVKNNEFIISSIVYRYKGQDFKDANEFKKVIENDLRVSKN